MNLYRSSVKALAGPDNRLDGRQPWTATAGFDLRIGGLPLNVGNSLGLTPPPLQHPSAAGPAAAAFTQHNV